MKGNELRVGNLVTKATLGGIDGTEYNDYIVDYIDNNNRPELFPVYLSEEHLLKLGFIKDGAFFSKGRFHYNIENKIFYSGNDHVSGGNGDAIIKFVHQLQNLYYALTGEELTIK